MPEDTTDPPSRGPIDTELLDRIAAHLARSDRFDNIQTRPEYAPNAVVADYDLERVIELFTYYSQLDYYYSRLLS